MASSSSIKNSPVLLTLLGCIVLLLLYMAVFRNGNTAPNDTPVPRSNNPPANDFTNRPPYTPPESPDRKAKDPAAHNLTKLYCAALVNPNQVPNLVRQNRAAFENIEAIRRCAANFRQRVIQEAVHRLSRDDYYKAGIEIAGSDPDLQIIAGKAADNLASGSGDLMAVSGYLVELADSIDGMLRNDDQAYKGTQVYQAFAPMHETLGQMGGSEILGPKFWTFVSQLSYECLYPLVAAASR